MSERITRANLDERCANVNRRLAKAGRAVFVQGRNGHTCLDEYRRLPEWEGTSREWQAVNVITYGTKAEIGQFLRAMMLGIDLQRRIS